MQHTYATLVAALINETAEKSTEFATALPITIIPNGELRLLRDLDLTIFDTVVSGVLAAGTPLTPKPAGCLVTRDLFVRNTSSNRIPLMDRDYSYALDYWPNSALTTSTPKYYADYDADNWYIAGTPSTAFSYNARCMIRPEGLSDTNTETWMSINVADVLQFACLIAAAEFLQQTTSLAIWAQEYADRLAAAKNEFYMLRRQAYMPVAGIPNKVKQEQ